MTAHTIPAAKILRRLTLVVAASLSLLSCGGGSSGSGTLSTADVSGVWFGTFTTPGGSGTVVVDITQADNTVTAILDSKGGDLPLAGTATGNAIGNDISLQLQSSGITLQIAGHETGNTLQGTIASAEGAQLATWQAVKADTRAAQVLDKKYLVSSSDPDGLAVLDSTYWIADSSLVYPTVATGDYGEYGIPVDADCTGGLGQCGQGFACSDYDGNLRNLNLTVQGWSLMAPLPNAIAARSPTCHDNTMWAIAPTAASDEGYGLLIQADSNGIATGTTLRVGFTPEALAFDGTDIWATVGVGRNWDVTYLRLVARISAIDGHVLAVYRIPPMPGVINDHLVGLAWNGSALASLQVYSSPPPSPPNSHASIIHFSP